LGGQIGIGTGGGVLLTMQKNKATNELSFVGVSETTGAKLWTTPIPNSSSGLNVCAITSTQFLVKTNGQLVVLSLKNGHQLSFANYDAETCNNVLPGGAAYYLSEGITVKQVLTP
jgi:outer membrane protein assembly factor BamB